jgi:hypothetical protein
MLGVSNAIIYKDWQDYPPPSSYSMSFDGVGDFLAVTATSFPIELDGEDLSISFWVKRDSDDGDASVILGHSSVSSYKRLHFNADGDVLDIESDQNGENAYATVTADTNWHHYVITSQGAGSGAGGASTAIMYEDGAALSTSISNWGNNLNKDFTIDRIGSDGGAGSTELKGLLYQLAIFDTVLAPTTITAMYNGGTPIAIDGMSNLLHLWKFSEGSGSTTADSAGSLTATLNGNAAFSSTTP